MTNPAPAPIPKPAFIFSPGKWIGEGKISFSGSPEILRFFTRWEISSAEPEGVLHEITCHQVVEMQGGAAEEHIKNRFTVSQVNDNSFVLELENELIGVVQGKGIIDAKKIAWEFRGHPTFEGFEVYELQENGDYLFHAEYVSPDQFRSIIDGRIWKKATEDVF